MFKSLSLTIACIFLAITNVHADKITLKLAHDLDRNHAVSKAFDHFAKDVAKLSDNEIKIRIYGNGQMGGARETMELLLSGGLDMTKGSSNLESFADIYKVFSLPYLFRDKQHHDAVVYGEIGRNIMQSTKDKGFFALAAYDTGTRSFYSNKDIVNPSDLKGIKVRVQPSQTSIQMVELMGGSPTPVSFSEIYTALQQGIIDGAENNIPTWVNARHIELVKVYSEDEHTSVPDFLVISTKSWNKLNDKQKEIIIQAARNSELWHGDLWAKEMKQAREDAIKLGGKIVKSNKEEFKKLVQPIYEEYRKDPQNAKLLDLIDQAGK